MSTPAGDVYLGDAVYARVQHGMIRLVLNSHDSADPPIFLEPEVFAALVAFARSKGWRVAPACGSCSEVGGNVTSTCAGCAWDEKEARS